MELDFDRETVTGYEIAAEKTICQEETMETIVPDSCPDVLRIVRVSGQPAISGKQIQNGTVSVSGSLNTVLLYTPEGGGGLCRMEAALPFLCQLELPDLSADSKVLARCRLCCADARILNSRKVLIRAEIAADLTVCSPVTRTYCCGASGPDSLGLCQKEYRTEDFHISDIQEKRFSIEDEIRLKLSQGQAPTLLDACIDFGCTECKLIGSKLVFKGSAEVNLLLSEADGTLNTLQESIPFSQIMEVLSEGERCCCRVDVAAEQIRCCADPDDPGRVTVQLQLLAQAQVSGAQPVTVLEDLYSTVYRLNCTTEDHTVCQSGEETLIPQPVRELLETEGEVHSIADSHVSIGEVRRTVEQDDLILTADAWVSVLYLDGTDQPRQLVRNIPVSCRLNHTSDSGFRYRCGRPRDLYCAPSVGGLEVRFNLEFRCTDEQRKQLVSIASAELGAPRSQENDRRPSVILRLAGSDESLWDIAKAYGTTLEQIRQANSLQEEDAPRGRMLLIPSVR